MPSRGSIRHGEPIVQTPTSKAAAAAAIDEAVHPHGDPFASEEYRRSALGTLFRRALQEACDGAPAR